MSLKILKPIFPKLLEWFCRELGVTLTYPWTQADMYMSSQVATDRLKIWLSNDFENFKGHYSVNPVTDIVENLTWSWLLRYLKLTWVLLLRFLQIDGNMRLKKWLSIYLDILKDLYSGNPRTDFVLTMAWRWPVRTSMRHEYCHSD